MRRSSWTLPSQLLKSPTTETRIAFGAKTAKRMPETPPIFFSCAPRNVCAAALSPALNLRSSTSGNSGIKRYGSSATVSLPSASGRMN